MGGSVPHTGSGIATNLAQAAAVLQVPGGWRREPRAGGNFAADCGASLTGQHWPDPHADSGFSASLAAAQTSHTHRCH